MSQLPVEPAWRLAERAEEHRWLVTGLWSEQAVGIVGGEPKCCKSFLALDLAVAVASGMPCLRRFSVSRAGRVLLFAAEDALHIVRRRLEGIASAAGVALADLDIQVITSPVLRLDLDADRRNLAETVARLQPRLLILDPFVRLHRIDENASGEVAPLLAYLRELVSCELGEASPLEWRPRARPAVDCTAGPRSALSHAGGSRRRGSPPPAPSRRPGRGRPRGLRPPLRDRSRGPRNRRPYRRTAGPPSDPSRARARWC